MLVYTSNNVVYLKAHHRNRLVHLKRTDANLLTILALYGTTGPPSRDDDGKTRRTRTVRKQALNRRQFHNDDDDHHHHDHYYDELYFRTECVCHTEF